MKSFGLKRVTVASIESGRYQPGQKPVYWNERDSAIEQITTDQGEAISLLSSGGQATPAPGWEILLTEPAISSDKNAFRWTLYGIKN